MLSETRFWKFIEESRSDRRRNAEGQFERVREALSTRSPQEILGFQETLAKLKRDLFAVDLFIAGLAPGNYYRNFSFGDFRNWIVLGGRERFKKALKKPDALAGELEPDDIAAAGKLEEAIIAAGRAKRGEFPERQDEDRSFEHIGMEEMNPWTNEVVFKAMTAKIRFPEMLREFWPRKNWAERNIPFAREELLRCMAESHIASVFPCLPKRRTSG